MILRVLVPDPSRAYTVEAKDMFGRAVFRATARNDGLGGDDVLEVREADVERLS